MWFFVVRLDCGVDGFVTPRFKYVRVGNVLYDLARVLPCGLPMIHVPGVGRFLVRENLRVVSHAQLHGADRGIAIGDLKDVVRACSLVGWCRLVPVRGGFLAITNVARLDVVRFAYELPINIVVDNFVF